ncbi:malate dehydrogenase [Salinigranum rubrum]|uniref:Malate dehydrogenase n=1 Tax=Salinigranum rubrum TaxID=755307 RepID=A0A2I8VKK5_9EURY|nr:malate dehydrogenase [Salinigranum rubrum]
MRRLIELAAESGVAVGVVKHSNHFGTAAYYTEMAAEHDCIGFAMTNVPAEVIPFGGREPYLGTNPISVSVPSPLDYPITLDMATSVVAMGKIDHVAAEKGESVPEEWGVDAEGSPTTDPTRIEALRPLGGAKGYCLGVIVDLLCGVLSGANISADVGSLYDDFDQSMDAGHFFLVIDIATFRALDEFLAHVGRFVEGLKAIEPDAGVEEVLLPGEIESRALVENRERGVPVNGNVFEKLTSIAAGYGVETPPVLD